MKVSRLANLILIYLLMWGIAELVPDLIFGDASSSSALMFTVFVPVQEQGGHIYLLNLHFSTLFEFLIPVIFAPIMVWLIFKEIKKEKSEIEEKSKYSNFLIHSFTYQFSLWLLSLEFIMSEMLLIHNYNGLLKI
ncbi:MAG: hypothetical protein ACTSYZ_15280 [Candidatus Helarchaeota archaeon]